MPPAQLMSLVSAPLLKFLKPPVLRVFIIFLRTSIATFVTLPSIRPGLRSVLVATAFMRPLK